MSRRDPRAGEIMNPVTSAEILTYCAQLQQNLADEYARDYPKSTPPKVYPDKGGKKYVRIVRDDPRSVICFVEVATGLIWKPAGWKGPAKNFPRGNIRDAPRTHRTPDGTPITLPPRGG